MLLLEKPRLSWATGPQDDLPLMRIGSILIVWMGGRAMKIVGSIFNWAFKIIFLIFFLAMCYDVNSIAVDTKTALIVLVDIRSELR